MTQEDLMIEYVWYALCPKECMRNKSSGSAMYIENIFYSGNTKICYYTKPNDIDEYTFIILNFRDKKLKLPTSVKRHTNKLDSIIKDITSKYNFQTHIEYCDKIGDD